MEPGGEDLAEAIVQLKALCEHQLQTEEDPDRRGRLHYELGRVCEGLDEHVQAAKHYQAALETSPSHAAAIRGACRVLRAAGSYVAIPPLIDREVGLTRDPATRARLLYEKAVIQESFLHQRPAALQTYEAALALDPSSVVVLKAIERCHLADKAWAKLAAVYEQLANAVQDPALSAAWTARQAHLTETKLADPELAATLYQRAVAMDPLASEGLLNLKRLDLEAERWPGLVRALRTELELSTDERSRHLLLTTIARVEEEHLGDAGAAIQTLEHALAERPEDRGVLTELARVNGALGRVPGQANALARLTETSEQAGEAAELCWEIGQLHEHHTNDVEGARRWYERALAHDPRHAASADALGGLLARQNAWAALYRMWSTQVRALSDPAQQGALHHRIGLLLERQLRRPADAVAHHAQALALDSSHHEAFLSLSRLLAEDGRWHELAELFQRYVDRASSEGEAIAWLFRLGAIYEDHLNDAVAALGVYERILALDPSRLGALHAVARTAERAERWDRLVAAVQSEAQLTADLDRRSALLHRASIVILEDLGDALGAARALEELLTQKPDHRPALETLARVRADAGQWDRVVQLYARILPLVGRDEKIDLQCRIAMIRERHLSDDTGAVQACRMALALDGTNREARERLEALLRKTQAWDALVALKEKTLAAEEDRAASARLATELGALCEEKLGDVTKALAFYDRAIDAVPLHRPALDARHRILTATKSWKKLADAMLSEADSSVDELHRIGAALRAATVLTDQSAVDPALAALERVLAARPDHVGALLALADIHARKGDEDGLVQAHSRIVGAVSDPQAALAELKELARLSAKRGEDGSAIQKRILLLAPDDRDALEALALDAEVRGDAPGQLSVHSRLGTGTSHPTLGAHHQIRIGEIRLAVGDAAGALSAFRSALDLDGRSLMAVRGLTLAARATGDPEAMRLAARHERHVTRDLDESVTLSLEAAQILYDAGHEDRAAAAFAEALELEPDSPEAAAGLMASMMRSELIPRLIELLTHAAYAARDTTRTAALHLSVAQLQADLRLDLPAAIAAVRRALSARPNHDHANAMLATYLERNGQWTLAVEALEQALPKLKGAMWIDAQVRLARIRERHLRDPVRAKVSLRQVLEREPEHPTALTSLARIERLDGNLDEALGLVRKLLSIVRDDLARGAALAEMAELEKAQGNLDSAAESALAAIAIQGPRGSASQLYRGLIDRNPDVATYEGYCSALMNYLEYPGARGDLAAAYRELARVYGQASGGADRAIAILKEGVQACPADPSISLALVRALRTAEKHAGALSEIRRLLTVDVCQPGAWRALAEVLQALGDSDGAPVALAPLVALGQASSKEAEWVRSRGARPAAAPPGTLGRRGLDQLVGPNPFVDKNATFVAALHEVITKLEGIDYARWGIQKRDRIRQGEVHPVRAYADSIARIFGAPEFDLFIVDRASMTRTWVLCGSPPALLVPASVAASRESVLAFQLARPLALLSRHLHPLEHVDDGLMDRMLVATVRQFDPSYVISPYLDEDAVEVQSRRVAKAIGFFSRGRIQEAAAAFASGQAKDYLAWARESRLLAARLGLLVADDLLGALDASEEELGPENYATDLARFWVSDAARRFRRAING